MNRSIVKEEDPVLNPTDIEDRGRGKREDETGDALDLRKDV